MKKKKTQPYKPTYKITATFNGETVTEEANTILSIINKIRPELLQTEMYLTIERGNRLWERRLDLIRGRKLFNDKEFYDIFINNLI